MCVKLVLDDRYGTLVYEVGYGHVWNAGVGCQPYFAGTAVGIADADAGCFYLRTELAQGIRIQLGICKAPVAGKTAATDFFRHNDLCGTETRQSDNRVSQSHFAHGTSDVDCSGTVDRCEHQSVA